MMWAVLQFPGSCDERDALHACTLASGEARLIWHEARDLGDVDRFAFYDHMKAYTAAPPDVVEQTRAKYVEAYERITGQSF